MRKPAKAEIMREVKDYIYITLGSVSYTHLRAHET